MQINPEDFVSFYVNDAGYFIPKDSVRINSHYAKLIESKVIGTATQISDNILLSVLVLLQGIPLFKHTNSPYIIPLNLVHTKKAMFNNRSNVNYSLSSNFDSYDGQLITNLNVAYIISVKEFVPLKRENDFCQCKFCQDIIHMAGPNQPDGTFICYSCRTNPIRIYY